MYLLREPLTRFLKTKQFEEIEKDMDYVLNQLYENGNKNKQDDGSFDSSNVDTPTHTITQSSEESLINQFLDNNFVDKRTNFFFFL